MLAMHDWQSVNSIKIDPELTSLKYSNYKQFLFMNSKVFLK